MTDDEVRSHKNMPPDRAAYLLHLTKFAGFRSRMFIDKRQIYSYFLPKIRTAPPLPKTVLSQKSTKITTKITTKMLQCAKNLL